MDASDVTVVVVLVVALTAVYVVPIVLCGLKGKNGLVTVGVFFHPCWWVGAVRLAKPGSWWARHRYGPEKRARSDARFSAPAGGGSVWAPDVGHVADQVRGQNGS